jgi:hypothetical protein
MSRREVDLEGLFDRDADSRLLDRRRRDELGLAPYVSAASSTPANFGAESIVETDPATEARPATLRIALDARPDTELIPGALVTIVATLYDDGDAPLSGTMLRISVPPEAEPVAGSFALNDVAIDGAALLGEGQHVGTIGPRASVRVRFALGILSGTAPIDILAHASASGAPAVAPPALRLRRRAGHAAYEKPRPFFELETGEAEVEPGGPALPEVPPRLVDAVLDEPALPPVTFTPPALPEVAAAEPAPPQGRPVPSPEPPARAPNPSPAAAEHVLQRSIESDEVRALERIFAGAVPHGLAHLTLLSALAAADGPLGEALGLGPFARAISAALPRALVAARIGRPPPPVVTAEALASLRPAGAAPASSDASSASRLVLRLGERELESLRAVLARTLDDPFLRGAQVLLGIAPRSIEGVPAEHVTPVREALANYRVVAGTWLMRTTVRRAVDRRFDPLAADDALLQKAGRTLVAALRAAIPA